MEDGTIAQHLRRFYIELLPEAGETALLSGDEAHHLLNVIRVRPGEEVALFDGKGREATARVIEGRRREAVLEILSTETLHREPSRNITIACALPRSARMDWLVEKCSEIGVTQLIPMVTARSVVKASPRENNQMRRWQRTAIESAKQCGRTRLMEITQILPFNAVIEQAIQSEVCVMASPEPEAVSLAKISQALSPNASIFALFGPEGGFTEEEIKTARQAGCQLVSLGNLILRVETAAVAAAILLTSA